MKKVVTFGEIMLRLSPPGYARFTQAQSFEATYGGGEANVAISLAQFGLLAEFVTRLPDNDLGKTVISELRRHSVGVDHIIKGGDRLGLYFLEKGSVARGGQVIYDRANSAISQIQPGMIDWEHVFDGCSWFHWTGITPGISENAAAVTLEAVEAAHELRIPVSVDFNYRSKLWNYGKQPSEIMPEMLQYCDVMLLSKEDAQHHLDIVPDDNGTQSSEGVKLANTYRSIGEQVFERFPKTQLILSSRRKAISANHNEYSALVYDGTRIYQSRNYEITHIVDRVGGGDALMAGFIYGLSRYGTDYQQALEFSVAAATLKHTIPGDANLVTADEVIKLMDGEQSGRVER